MDNETVVFHTRNGEGYRFGICEIASNRGTLLGDGFVECLSDNKKHVCLSNGGDFINRNLFVYNFDTQNEKRIGSGRFPCFFQGDTKLVFFPSPEKKAIIYSMEEETTKEIELPGRVDWLPAVCGEKVLLRLSTDHDLDRSGSFYILQNGILTAVPVPKG